MEYHYIQYIEYVDIYGIIIQLLNEDLNIPVENIRIEMYLDINYIQWDSDKTINNTIPMRVSQVMGDPQQPEKPLKVDFQGPIQDGLC